MPLKICLCAIIGAVCGLVFWKFAVMLSRKCQKTIPKESRIDVLRKYSSYECREDKFRHPVKIVLKRPVPEILQKYNYSAYCCTDNDNKDEIVFSMLDFVCTNFKHISNATLPTDRSLEGIIKHCEETELMTNCRGLSLILAELLRMNGIRARHVTCKPYEEPFEDCHVVVDCLMPSGARIMLDPTYRLYFADDSGGYVSLEQLREGIIEGKTFHPNSNASYNGLGFDYSNYIEYMTKNVFRFNTNYNLNNSDSMMSEIELVPKRYTTNGFSKVVQYTTDPDYFWNID